MIMQGKPMFVIGSPPCTAFSTMQNLSKGKRNPEVVEEELRQAKEHMRFCIEIYIMQVEARRCFVHEHPVGASSWDMKEMIELMMGEDVGTVTVDMCSFGMTATDKGREGPVQKATRIVSNSHEVLKRVDRKCPNRGGVKVHDHVVLEGGRTKQAQVYPREFCRAVCEGIAAEKRLRALGLEVLSLEEIQEAADRYGVAPDKDLHEEDWAVDDQSGEELDVQQVRGARKEEIMYFRKMKVYDKVPKSKCWEETNRAPIGVRWVDINKGDSMSPNYRSRLVAMEFETDVRPEWYAATPPSECLKIILSKMASNKSAKMLYADVSRAYFKHLLVGPYMLRSPQRTEKKETKTCAGDSGSACTGPETRR